MWTVLNEEYDIKYTFLDVDDELLIDLKNDIKEIGDCLFGSTNLTALMTNWKTETKSFSILENKIFEVVPECNKNSNYRNHWGAIYRDGDHAKPHTHEGGKHPDPDLSFTFYIDAPEGSGELYFPECDLTVIPENKMLITFSPRACHQVLPNSVSDIERILTAGNIDFSVDNV